MEFKVYFTVFILALLSGLTTLIGVALAFLCKKSCNLIVIGIGFSTGIMVLISAFELIPEAIHGSNWLSAIIAGLVGVLIAILLNKYIPHTHLVKEKGSTRKKTMITAAYMIAFGLILHDVPEGFAMANSYVYAPSLGVLVAIAIALHNIPEEFAMTIPLLEAGKGKKFIFKLALLSGLAEPVGAILGLVAVSFFAGLSPWLMAFTAGIMIFISFHELLPMARRYGKPGLLFFGLLLSIVIYTVLTIALPE